MALLRKINTKAKTEDNTGFGTNSTYSGGRFFNRDGSPNIIKRGLPFWDRNSIYHTLIGYPSWKFLLVVIGGFVLINIGFASLYYLIGIDHLGGMKPGTPLENFGEAFFFSAQTFTTVGYGRISPVGFVTSFVAALEALIGLLCFAVATGLLYGRFAKPKAYLRFSDYAVIAPYKGGTAFMFRMTPYKNNQLLDVETKISLAMKVEDGAQIVNRFFNLDLEISKVNALTLSWTLVHPITEKSPLYNLKPEEYETLSTEFLIFIKAFDESFSNNVVARSSYTAKEIVFGAKFKPMYYPNEQHNKTILDVSRLNEIEMVALPEPVLIQELNTTD